MADELVGSKEIAKWCGISIRRVQQLVEEGVFVAVKKGRVNRYNLIQTVRAYIDYLDAEAKGRNKKESDSEKRKMEAEADLKRSKADMAALQLKELEGKMHRAEDVEDVMTDLVYTIKNMLVALPGRLAVDVSAVYAPAEASVIIREEVYKILTELSNYRYDPQVYAKKVMEREGWNESLNEEE